MYFAIGYGGQYIGVLPALDMVIVITSDQNIAGDSRSIVRAIIDALGTAPAAK